jgi:hypothetical protein
VDRPRDCAREFVEAWVNAATIGRAVVLDTPQTWPRLRRILPWSFRLFRRWWL